jgi:hypothetical protein
MPQRSRLWPNGINSWEANRDLSEQSLNGAEFISGNSDPARCVKQRISSGTWNSRAANFTATAPITQYS